MEIGKIHFFNDQWKMLLEEKCLIKNKNLRDVNYHWKYWLDWILDTWWDKTLLSQKYTFWEKKAQKVKKNKTILNFMTILNNVALKIEIGFERQGCLKPL